MGTIMLAEREVSRRMLWNVMAILLLLLKIVGILLFILLFLLLLILFVPLRYRLDTSFYEEKRFRGRVSWLGFVLRAVFLWEEGETCLKLRVFGIPLVIDGGNGNSFFSKKEKRKKKNKKRELAKNKQNIENQRGESEKIKQMEQSEIAEWIEETEQMEQSGIAKPIEEMKQPEESEKEQRAEKSESKSQADGVDSRVSDGRKKRRGILAWIRKWWEKIKNFFHTLQKLFRLFREKAGSLGDLADLLREEESRHSICIVKDNMIHLWKQIHPRKIRGDIVFGTGDPCTTGQALGGIALFYAWMGSGVHIVPDFQEKRLEGKLDVLGRIRIISLIVIIVKLMFHKDVKELWQKLEQWKEDF